MTISSAPQGSSRRRARGTTPPPQPAPRPQPAPPRYPTFDTPRPLVQVPAAAPLGRRIAAWLIDLAAVALVTVGAWLLTGSLLVTVVVAIEILVGLAVWEGHTGCTFGQLALGLRTVRAGTAESAGAPRALPRALAFGASHLLVVGPLVLLLTAASDHSRRRQAWHDRIGDLQVVDVRRTEFIPAAQETTAEQGAAAMASPQPAAPYGATGPARPAAPPAATGRPAAPGAPAPAPAPAPAAPPAPAPAPTPAPVPMRHGTPPAAPVAPPAPPRPNTPSAPVAGAPATPAPPPAAPPVPPAPAVPPSRRLAMPREQTPEPAAPADDAAGLPLHTLLPREAVTRLEQPERRRRSSRPAPSGPVPAFRTDDGTVTPVDRIGYIGRRPSAPDEHPDALLVTVPDEDRSVSRSHGRFGVTSGQLWYEDLGSGNGSILELPDGRSADLTAHQRVSLPTGSRLIIGSHTVQIVEHRG